MPSILKPITYVVRKIRMGVHNSIHRRRNPEKYFLQDKTERVEILSEGLFSVHYYPALTDNRVDIEGESVASTIRFL
jgi:hypothetical protein